jgi:SulP family sulfate permease
MGGDMYLIQVKQQLWDALQACDCMDEHSDRNIFESKQAAVHGIYQKLDKEICATCDKRIFIECQQEFGKPSG